MAGVGAVEVAGLSAEDKAYSGESEDGALNPPAAGNAFNGERREGRRESGVAR